MEPPAPSSNSGPKLNLTAIAIAGLACLTLLVLALLFAGRSGGSSIVSSRPELPVFITWRETKMPGQTQVARIWAKPEAQLPLRVIVQIESSVTGDKKAKEIVLERRHIEDPWELGWLEGHTFVPGDTISVGHKDFAPVRSTCRPLR
jgi:hypothetical protein